MTGNGKHATYKNGDDWPRMGYYCFNHIRGGAVYLPLLATGSICMALLRRKVVPDHVRNVYLATDEADTSGYHKAGPWPIQAHIRMTPSQPATSISENGTASLYL